MLYHGKIDLAFLSGIKSELQQIPSILHRMFQETNVNQPRLSSSTRRDVGFYRSRSIVLEFYSQVWCHVRGTFDAK
ncbi:hypothetical protein JTE90_010389 [Oedothorax gibbosus]|uniref:Uncharacterized protein n=1 Tax=Oedothorax gibbosus TaxID=931172 RepID=A0AAV6W2C5_9ARAC|nr:hypothetical protein JTE90_010389 [Oedothorax gibbosus]